MKSNSINVELLTEIGSVGFANTPYRVHCAPSTMLLVDQSQYVHERSGAGGGTGARSKSV